MTRPSLDQFTDPFLQYFRMNTSNENSHHKRERIMKSLVILLAIHFASSVGIASDAPKFGPILKHPNGNIRTMNFTEAYVYCKSQGMFLPSMREFAILAESLGAKGIKDIHEFPNENEAKKKFYEPVTAISSKDLKKDSFYYSRIGYKPPNDVTHMSFWTSSWYRSDDWAYVFSDSSGVVHLYNTTSWTYKAVRCVYLEGETE